MPLFFLHVRNQIGLVEDEEGQELADIDAAREEALRGARSILSEEANQGRIDLRGTIIVTDSDGTAVVTLPFSDAVELYTGNADTEEGRRDDD